MPEQQRAPVPEADIPPPPRELVWLQKGYSPPVDDPRKSFFRLFGFGDDKKEPGDAGDTFEKDSSDKPKLLTDTSAVATATPPPPHEVVWLDKGYSPPPRKSIFRRFGFDDDKKSPPSDTGDTTERQLPPKPKILPDDSAVAITIPPPHEVVWLGEGYALPPRKSILQLLGLGDDKKNPPDDTGGDVEFDDPPPPQKPKPS